MRTLVLLTVVCIALPFASAAEEPKATPEPKLLMTERGKVIFEDPLTKPFDSRWKAGKGKWEIVDGVMKGVEVKDDMHGAVVRTNVPFTNAIIRYDFKLDGAKQTSLSINDSKGHVCRVLIRADALIVQKDDSDGKTGPDKAVQLHLLKAKIDTGWHTVQIELCGKELLASLDGKEVAFGEHETLDRPKTNIGLTVAGESVYFRNLKVWEATPSKDWEKAKSDLKK